MDKQSAVRHLVALIENSTNIKHRLESLQILRKISINFGNLEGNTDSLLSFFENLLVSDTDELIRNEAALILYHEYKEKAFDPMRWALHHEESPFCLQTIYNSLINIVNTLLKRNERIGKLIFVHEIKKISDKDFKIGIEILKSNLGVKDFSLIELADIIKKVSIKKAHMTLSAKIEKKK